MNPQQLIEKVLSGSQYLWHILVWQAEIDSILLVLAGIVLILVGLNLFKKREKLLENVSDDVGIALIKTGMVALIVIGFIFLIVNIDGVIFPQGTAAQWLLTRVK